MILFRFLAVVFPASSLTIRTIPHAKVNDKVHKVNCENDKVHQNCCKYKGPIQLERKYNYLERSLIHISSGKEWKEQVLR